MYVNDKNLYCSNIANLLHLTFFQNKDREKLKNILINSGLDDSKEIYKNLIDFSFLFSQTVTEEQFQRLWAGLLKSESLGKNKISAGRLKEILSKKRDQVPFYEVCNSLWLFTLLLVRALIRDGRRDVFFLSREGEFLKVLFDDVIKQLGLDSCLKSHYLLVSRRATFTPSLSSLDNERFEGFFRQYANTSIYEFLLSLNFDEEDFVKIGSLNLDLYKERIPDLKDSDIFKKLLESEIFRKLYDKKRREQKQYFLEYLESAGADFKAKDICIVDVGWKGTIQDNIYRILDWTVQGYYLGITENVSGGATSKKRALLFSVPDRSKYAPIYNQHRPIFEILLGASHGGVTSYGSAGALTEWHQIERDLYESFISKIQSEFRLRASELTDMICGSGIPIDTLEREVAAAHGRVVLTPRKLDIDFYRKLTHMENFGVFQFANYSAPELSTIQKSYNFFRFVKKPREILNSNIWPVLALHDSGLGYLQGYYKKYILFKVLYACPKIHYVFPVKIMQLFKSDPVLADCMLCLKNQRKMIVERERYIKKLKAKWRSTCQ